LEQALDLFKMPRNLGEFEGQELVIGIGRFGPFVRHDGIFVSIPKTDDPYSIDIDRAIELIKAKRQADIEKTIKVFKENPEVKILKGRWGPYLVFGRKNIRIPKNQDPEKLTYADCVKLDQDTPETPKGKARRQAAEKAESKKTGVVKKQAPKKSPIKAAPKKAAPKKATSKKSVPAKKTKKK
jgi:DNA topoisomerase-1